MQRASSENQGECWHAKSRRKNEKKRKLQLELRKARKTSACGKTI
jgi:hypothetical protein